MYEDQEGREDKSPCSKVKNIANIMVKKLEDRIKQIKTWLCDAEINLRIIRINHFFILSFSKFG